MCQNRRLFSVSTNPHKRIMWKFCNCTPQYLGSKEIGYLSQGKYLWQTLTITKHIWNPYSITNPSSNCLDTFLSIQNTSYQSFTHGYLCISLNFQRTCELPFTSLNLFLYTLCKLWLLILNMIVKWWLTHCKNKL